VVRQTQEKEFLTADDADCADRDFGPQISQIHTDEEGMFLGCSGLPESDMESNGSIGLGSWFICAICVICVICVICGFTFLSFFFCLGFTPSQERMLR
jgi:hypothetical protein